MAGGTDDLPERGVEPIGEGGTTVGDAADRSGVTAKAEPASADHQLRAGESRCLGVAEQVGDELTGRLGTAPSSEASMLAAKAVTRPSVAPAATRACCAEAWARLRPPAVVASVRVTSWTGRAALAA